MSEFNIPKLNKKSDKFLFKKKLSLRRKSKNRLLKEIFLMLSLSTFLIYLNYQIPYKKRIFEDFFNNINKLIEISSELNSYIYEIFLIIFMFFSMIIIFTLIFGAISRMFKISKKVTKKVPFS